MNVLQFYKVSRIIISTLPATRSGWMRADLISRVRKASNIEVEHIVAEPGIGSRTTSGQAQKEH